MAGASQIIKEPSNQNNPNYSMKLSDADKDNIAKNVESNNLDDDLVEADKILSENGVGGPKINLFTIDETSNYSLPDW